MCDAEAESELSSKSCAMESRVISKPHMKRFDNRR